MLSWQHRILKETSFKICIVLRGKNITLVVCFSCPLRGRCIMSDTCTLSSVWRPLAFRPVNLLSIRSETDLQCSKLNTLFMFQFPRVLGWPDVFLSRNVAWGSSLCFQSWSMHWSRKQATKDAQNIPSCHRPHGNWLLEKDPDARKHSRHDKGTTEDEIVGWHHQLDGHEFELALGVGDGQGALGCCSLWGHRVGHNWETELTNWTHIYFYLPC